MMVQFDLVGNPDHPPIPSVDIPCVPRVGDTVDIPEVSQANTVVRTVVWYVFDNNPTAYVVLGSPRP